MIAVHLWQEKQVLRQLSESAGFFIPSRFGGQY